MSSIEFRRVHSPVVKETACLAAALLVSRYCGEVIEFEAGTGLGADFGEAVRALAPAVRFIQPIDGLRRTLCAGDLHLIVAEDASRATGRLRASAGPGHSRLVTWSGDFVSPCTRSSAGHLAGEITTNAALVAPVLEVSVALGLLVGGMEIQSIAVAATHAEMDRVAAIANALSFVGIKLHAETEPEPLVLPVAQLPGERPYANGALHEVLPPAARPGRPGHRPRSAPSHPGGNGRFRPADHPAEP